MHRTLTTVKDAVIRLAIFLGEFPWHKVESWSVFLMVEAIGIAPSGD